MKTLEAPTKRPRRVAIEPTSAEGRTGQAHLVTPGVHAESALAEVIASIRFVHAEREAAEKMRRRLTNQCGAFVRSRLGWRVGLPLKQRNEIRDRAAVIIRAIESGSELSEELRDDAQKVSRFVLCAQLTRAPLDKYAADLKQVMRDLARKLPVMPWVDGVLGMSDLSLARLVGETGDLSGYANPAKLWKRMGLGCVSDGTRQRKAPGTEAAAEHGYCPKRRAVAWKIAHHVIGAQIRVERDEDGKKTGATRARAEYGQVYLDRKKYRVESGWGTSMGHRDNDARRYLAKRILRDLWRAWNNCGSV